MTITSTRLNPADVEHLTSGTNGWTYKSVIVIGKRSVYCPGSTGCGRTATQCKTVDDAIKLFNDAMLGRTLGSTALNFEPINSIEIRCPINAKEFFIYRHTSPWVPPDPSPNACTASAASITLTGTPTDVPAGGAYTTVHCQQRATVKLQIPNNGDVEVTSGGVVSLGVAGTGASASVVVDGSTPVWINASFKGWAQPGIYSGSTVLQLDIL